MRVSFIDRRLIFRRRNVMKHWIAASAAVVALAAAGTALAQSSTTSRTLYICNDGAATRAAFAKQFGEVKFLSAAQVRSAKGGWTTPRCITPREHARLMDMMRPAGNLQAANTAKVPG
jgi:hypothetical protein